MKIAVIISGASGIKLALEFASFLASCADVELVITKGAKRALKAESKTSFKQWRKQNKSICVHKNSNLAASISSGSYKIDAYFIYASANFSVAASIGLASNLALRAVAVAIKEKRKIIFAPREMPLSRMLLLALLRLEAAGCIIAPPLIAEYANKDAKEFIKGRWAQLLDLEYKGFKPWTNQ